MRRLITLVALAATTLASPNTARAQISSAEFAARRDSLAARIGDGVVVAFGGRTPVSDFGPFYQLPAFHYLTNFDEPDAAFVMVVHGGRGTSTVFVSPVDPRAAFYYGRRPDSAAAARALRDCRAPVLIARRDARLARRKLGTVLHAHRFRRRRLRAPGLAHSRPRLHEVVRDRASGRRREGRAPNRGRAARTQECRGDRAPATSRRDQLRRPRGGDEGADAVSTNTRSRPRSKARSRDSAASGRRTAR